MDYHLHPLVTKTSSYLKDTTDFLKKQSDLGHLPPDCILVTLDVSSLYTNIPHDEGLEACRLTLDTRSTPQQPPTANLSKLMEQILTLNNFTFNGEHYLQTNGTAMGTRMAPSLLICSWQIWRRNYSLGQQKDPSDGGATLVTFLPSGTKAMKSSSVS